MSLLLFLNAIYAIVYKSVVNLVFAVCFTWKHHVFFVCFLIHLKFLLLPDDQISLEEEIVMSQWDSPGLIKDKLSSFKIVFN